MPGDSNIGWTDKTWNPSTGCTPVDEDCWRCYAEDLALEMQAKGVKRYANGFKFTIHPDSLNWPLTVKVPSRIFVNSMSDLFHHQMPPAFLEAVVGTMKLASWHTFQVLTKRPVQMAEFFATHECPPNVYLGTSVGMAKAKWRIKALKKIKNCKVLFLSCEPILKPLEMTEEDLQGIQWVIAGAESGDRRRPFDINEARKLRDLCVKLGIPFFYKQGSSKYPGQNRVLDGRTWDEFPKVM